MSLESVRAASLLQASTPRSAASRYYYAAYQGVSALLLYVNLIPPAGREAWSHEDTPDLLVQHLNRVLPKRGERQDLANRLRSLYKVRISADYISQDDVETSLKRVRKDAEFIVKVAKDITNFTDEA